MTSIVNVDQTCSVPGRSIIDNCHLIRNIIDYAGQKEIESILVSLDLEKAFDKISHEYLFTVLDVFGFGSDFIKWIKLLYSDVSASVIVNGHISQSFPYTRGVRQGCCLSPLLYVLAVEPLADRIRRDKSIQGIKLPVTGEEAKVSQFADDLSVFVTSEQSISKLLVLLDIFHYASGSNVNKSKSKALNLGFWRNRPPDNIFGIPVVKNLKLVGLVVNQSGGVTYDWTKIVDPIRRLTFLWKSRSLSFFEKSILINSIALAKIWYIASSVVIPKSVIEKINKIIFKFLWGNRHECINRKSMMLHKQLGGVGIIDVQKKIEALRLSHIKSLLVSDHCKWKALAVYWFGFHLRNQEPVFGSNLIPHSDFKPPFYVELFKSFKLVNDKFDDFDWSKVSTKSLYNALSSLEPVSHKVTSKFPDVDFLNTWKSLNSGLLAPYTHDVCFLIAHQVVPTNDLLYRFNITRRVSCFFCREKESIKHLFFECEIVKGLVSLISKLLSTTENTLKLTVNNLLFYDQIPKYLEKGLLKLFIILCSEAKKVIWVLRNEAKFNSREVSSDLVVSSFIKSIHNRIKIDYNRLGLESFVDIWGISTICEVSDEEIHVVL